MTLGQICPVCGMYGYHNCLGPRSAGQMVPMSDPYKDAFIAKLEQENAALRAENARLSKAVHEIEQSARWALRFAHNDGCQTQENG